MDDRIGLENAPNALLLRLLRNFIHNVSNAPLPLLLLLTVTSILSGLCLIYIALFVLAPTPRNPLPSEEKYISSTANGTQTAPTPLPSWIDRWHDARRKAERKGDFSDSHSAEIDEPEIAMSVVVPAYNEEKRLVGMLEEAVAYLDSVYGRPKPAVKASENGYATGASRQQRKEGTQKLMNASGEKAGAPSGYEIIIVNDGSKDRTVQVALQFSKKHQLHDILRVVSLTENRGKGGAVTHGFRHVRGQYAIFADADGASKFSDLAKLVEGCQEVKDEAGRGVAVGSRAHMVGSDAVIKRSAIRNALMHSFHLLLRLMTPPATSRIGDTQCGFKLFSRASLPYIVPYMHAEGWIFDVEMLMLAESAPPVPNGKDGTGIRVKEVPIDWHEVGGSKLNVMYDSIGMAWGLALLRACWMFGVYRRR